MKQKLYKIDTQLLILAKSPWDAEQKIRHSGIEDALGFKILKSENLDDPQRDQIQIMP